MLNTLQRIISNLSSASRNPRVIGSGLLATSPLVVPLVPLLSSSSTPSTMLVRVSLTMLSLPRVEEPANSMVLSMSTGRPSPLMVLPVFTVVSFPPLLVSLCTVVSTSVSTIHSVRYSLVLGKFLLIFFQSLSFLLVLSRVLSLLPSYSAGVLPSVLVLLLTPWIPFGKFFSWEPSNHRAEPIPQSSHDDDFWWRSPLQVHVRCWLSDYRQGGYQVPLQRCWRQTR